jgi:hypothetical protein
MLCWFSKKIPEPPEKRLQPRLAAPQSEELGASVGISKGQRQVLVKNPVIGKLPEES